jgi:hypothetical protein
MMMLTTETETHRVTREELYGMVWRTPMSRLAEEFGITGNGLAKICDRLEVPYPPRGHWAKKQAGKPVVTFRLPPRKDGVPQVADIHPTPARPAPTPEARQSVIAVAEKVTGVTVLNGLDDLHPRVRAWIAEHKRLQKERELQNRRRGRNDWWTDLLLPDLTQRDLYRFRVTSAIFKGIEKAGGKIEESPITGKVTFVVVNQKVECSIVEELSRSLAPREENAKWTAFPNHHQNGLTSSGFLRVSIATYLGAGTSQWIETAKARISDLLPEIVGGIMAAGPILEQREQERQEEEKRRREAEARREEARRIKAVDDKRWAKFCQCAADWQERNKLLAFLVEVEKRAAEEPSATIADNSIDDWIAWARKRLEGLDPLQEGVASLFGAISNGSWWG